MVWRWKGHDRPFEFFDHGPYPDLTIKPFLRPNYPFTPKITTSPIVYQRPEEAEACVRSIEAAGTGQAEARVVKVKFVIEELKP